MRQPLTAKRPKQKRDKAALVEQLSPSQASSARGVGAWLPLASAQSSAVVVAWLSGIKATAAGQALKGLVREHPALSRLLAGIAEAAPYLWELVEADAARLARLLGADPDSALAALFAKTRSAAAAARSHDEVMRVLRQMKAEAALLVALADIGGVWPLARVTQALTAVAETALGFAAQYLLRDAVRRKILLPPDPRLPEAGSGYIVLAMGKMGAYELNYSSDIDLMVFFDPAAARLARKLEPIAFYVRLTRDLVKLLQERTADGY